MQNLSDFLSFGESLFASQALSLRLVAESKELHEKIDKSSSVVKLEYDKGSLESRAKDALALNAKGYSVFYLPTQFRSGYTESYKDIEFFRAFVVDLDGSPLTPVFDFDVEPSWVVESSPGKYQVVWVIEKLAKIDVKGKGDGITVDEYNEIATELAVLFGGDLNVCRATQPFRAPGFIHWKKEAFTSHTYWTPGEDRPARPALLGQIKLALKSSHRHAKSAEKGSEVTTKIDLEALTKGSVSVSKGLRHITLLRLMTKLMSEGKNSAQALDITKQVVSRSFEGGLEFLSNGRSREMEICLKDASTYVKVNKEREREEVQAILEKSEELSSKFEYNFETGSLKNDRYTEQAVVERVLQRFQDDLARIDGRIFCFNRGEALWKPQIADNCPEIKGRVVACIGDTVTEKEFIETLCTDSDGAFQPSMMHRAKAAFFKAGTISNMCRSVMGDIAVPRYQYKHFDACEECLYVGNGMLNMVTGELREALATDRLLNRTAIEWKGDAQHCDGWKTFLSEVFAENSDPQSMIAFMQEVFGYSLSGSVSEEKLFCHWGNGANGKSKTLNALRLICGEYSTGIAPDEIVNRKGASFTKAFERTGSKVEGKRVAVIDDMDVTAVWNEGFVKSLTGKTIRARAEYERSREVENRCKFHLGFNQAPEPETENVGILRRICIIPYLRRFKENGAVEKRLDAMVHAEACGILAWAVEGFRRVHARKHVEYPQETELAIAEYRKEHFKLESVIEELFKPGIEGDKGATWEPLSVLVEDVNHALEANGLYDAKVSAAGLGDALSKKMGFKSDRIWDSAAKAKVTKYLVKLLAPHHSAKSLL